MNKQEREVMERAMKREYDSLPQYCKDWRLSQGLTQVDMAIKGGVSKSCISRFESGDIKSTNALIGYMSHGMPLPYDLVLEYLKKDVV